MPKNRRLPHRTVRRSAGSPITPSFAIAAIAIIGILAVGGAIFSNFLMPDETQSSVDRRVMRDEIDLEHIPASNARTQEPTEPADLSATPLEFENLPEVPEPELVRMTGTIQSGDTPATLLEGHLKLAEIYSLCDESADVYPLNKLRAGQPWTMIYSRDALVGLEYEIDANERLVVSMSDSGYDFRREPIPYDVETVTVEGIIESSLFGAVLKLGETEDLAVRLADVFAYDVDFFRDLREGDSFRVVVDKKFRDGSLAGYGLLHAASFTNQGRTYYAYRYTDKKGDTAYYDQNGRPLRKAFLKAPLPFTRISSGFSMNRKHPILGFSRPHPAIDYAAPTGTPISTVADGTIAEAGFNKTQGNYVRIVHSNGYDTTYNHMSKFASGTKKGAKVKQGTVIGYVGSTGLATGPHLCFRLRQNGKPINPLTLKSMPSDPIAAKELPLFKAHIAGHKTLLEGPIRAASRDVAPKALN